jgi:hypothetical protein
MREEGKIFTIEKTHINYLQQAIAKMSKSSLIYSAIVPIVKTFIADPSIASNLNDFGINTDVIVSAINKDMKKDEQHRSFFGDFSSLLDSWDDLGRIYSVVESGNSDNLMDQFKDETLVDAFVNILSALFTNPIINPEPEPGD